MTWPHFLNLTKPWLCHNVNNSPLDSGALKVEHRGLKLKATDQLLSLDWERMCTVFTAVDWHFIVFFNMSFTLIFFLRISPPVLSLFSTGWRRRRRKRRRRKRPWSRPVRGRWRARRRQFRGAVETMMRRMRRASLTLSSNFCPDLYRTCSRSKKQTKQIKRTLNSGSSLAWARLWGKGRRGSLRRGLWVK